MDIKIDESKHSSAPSFFQRLKVGFLAIIFGTVLVQMYFFYGASKSGSFATSSIIVYFDNLYFIGYLAFCGLLGWFGGQDFLDWLKVKIDFWKFW